MSCKYAFSLFVPHDLFIFVKATYHSLIQHNCEYLEYMREQGSWFECPICYQIFNYEERKPMIICMSQHTVCKVCIEDMFKGKDKQRDQILCYLCRKPVFYNNVTPFYWLNELNQTKESLKREGSKMKKALTSDLKELRNEVIKEREKNEWLLQLLQQTKLKNTQTQEALEELMTYQMNQMKKMLKEERKQQSIEIQRYFQTYNTQTKEHLKKQADLRREESLKAAKQKKQQAKNLLNFLKKRFDTIQTENICLSKQFTPFKKMFSDFEQNVAKTLSSIQQGIKNMNEKMKEKGKCCDYGHQHQKSTNQWIQIKKEQPPKKKTALKEQKVDQTMEIKEQKKQKVEAKQSKQIVNHPLNRQVAKPSSFARKTTASDLNLTQKFQDISQVPMKVEKKEEKSIKSQTQLIKSKPLLSQRTERLKTQPDIFYLPPKAKAANPLSKQEYCKKMKEKRPSQAQLQKEKGKLSVQQLMNLSNSRNKSKEKHRSGQKSNRSLSMNKMDLNNNIQLADEIICQQSKFKHLVELLQSIVDDQGLFILKRKIEQFVEEHIHEDEEQIIFQFAKYKEIKK